MGQYSFKNLGSCKIVNIVSTEKSQRKLSTILSSNFGFFVKPGLGLHLQSQGHSKFWTLGMGFLFMIVY